jgi:two-component system chemotaxis sensor kinase CheA
MNLDDALVTFVAESRELLQEMEDALLQIEQNPDDADTLNAIFRAAHTIKGSAGLFGLDELVGFTHAAESVLDEVRSGEAELDFALAAKLLSACDHIASLVDCAAAGRSPDPALGGAGGGGGGGRGVGGCGL